MSTHGQAGFTLLEVLIALSILAVSLLVLVDAQSGAVWMTLDSQRNLTMTMLAEEKMSELQMRLEREGFIDSDIEEEGDFKDFGTDGKYGDGLDLEGAFEEYSWAYTIRRVDLSGGDITGAISEVASVTGQTATDEATSQDASSSAIQDMAGQFVQGDSLTDQLAPYIREARVLVWHGPEPLNEDGCENCVELTTHFVNPSGQVQVPGQ